MKKSVFLLLAALYYVLSWATLAWFDAGLVTTSFILFGLPAFVLAYYSYAPPPVLIAVATFGLGIAIVFESIAHVYGMWYTIGVDAGRLFGLVPVEVMVATIFEVTFLTLLYELIFDDGIYTTTNARTRYGAIGVFTTGVFVLTSIHTYAVQHFFVSYAYVWMLVIILSSSMAALMVYRVYSAQFLDRLVHFAIVGAVPSLIGLALAITNIHKVFANSQQYLMTLNVFDESVPLEAFLLCLALPFFVATIYELYLDDKS